MRYCLKYIRNRLVFEIVTAFGWIRFNTLAMVNNVKFKTTKTGKRQKYFGYMMYRKAVKIRAEELSKR